MVWNINVAVNVKQLYNTAIAWFKQEITISYK